MAVSYKVERSSSSSGPWDPLVGSWSGSPIELTGQTVGEVFWYRVVVSDTDLLGLEYATDPIRLPIGSTPVLTATGGEGAEGITLEWAPGCFHEYEVYRWNEDTDTWVLVDTTENLEYLDISVSQDIVYCYRITPRTSGGDDGPVSNVACASILPEGIFSMTSRATVYQGIQLGFESTPGTAVAATKRLLGIEMMPNPQIPIKSVVHQGVKSATGTQRGQEHTEGTYRAVLGFNLMTYLMTLMFGAVSPTQDLLAYNWEWTPDALAPLTPKTATIEQGSSAGAEKFAFSMIDELVIKWSKEDASVEGTFFGQEYLRNITMTSGLSEVEAMPVHPAAMGVYISDDGSTFTLLEDVIDGEFRCSGLWKPKFHQNPNEPSFDRVVERQPEFGMTLTVEDGTECDDFMTDLYAGQKVWLGIRVLGPNIQSGDDHEIKMQMPVYVEAPDFGDKDESHGSTFKFRSAHDADFGMIYALIRNTLASL